MADVAATQMTDTDVLVAHENTKTEPIATYKRPGVFIKLYPRTSKEGKPAVYGRFARRRPVKKDGTDFEDNPWINSINDLDAIIEACVEAKQGMREFYRQRSAEEVA